MERQTVIGIFKEGIDAQAAVQKLESTHHIGHDKVDIANPASASAKHVGSSTTDRDNDSVSGFFGSLFGKNDEASKHTQAARKGWVVTVHADSRQEAEQAAAVLDSCGAVDVDEHATQSSPQAGINRPQQDTAQPRTGQMGDSSQTIPIMEERLNVGKREVERGGVHMRSRIVERPVEEHLRLREEHLDIERNKVNRPATDRDFQNFKEGEINITERAEVPVVNKEARVVEEVKINKHTEERDETIRGTVRKTDVEIDKNRDRDQNLRNQGNKPDSPRNI
ncbi:YsnF/AvaK domain-containing protein [Pontibacter sp. HSC-14F20]|uniref:YsnF/AvaK domain-containing protein n=1 Tax=Pontibacter sp. HSC-14F20 TaxID=2864136 RepID=UPI001C73DD6D|nr:YsnF/AvaK domain-containing protein [Pontibacter sp. HSC-14F20]MBX0331754.1 YsnF/AvaK domain-containing protein [Pontibacter sp. HSC-14F20]